MQIVYNGVKDTRQFKSVIPATIKELMAEDPDVVWLDADLMSCSGTNKEFGKERFIDCGIAEANMVGIAAGMSAEGWKPFAHTFAPFASRRCFDQVFLSGGYAGNSLTVVGTDPGITAAFNGGTHMPFEDMAVYRTIPGAVVVDTTDVPMLRASFRIFKDTPGVKYIRTPRKDSYQVYSEDTEFEIGKGIVVREGTDAVIIACGIMVHEALQAAMKLEQQGVSVAVTDPYTVKPLDVELVRAYAQKTGTVIVAENHNKIGGLTSAVQDAICGMPCRFGYVAIEDEYGEVGPQDYLRKRFDLTDEHIIRVYNEITR